MSILTWCKTCMVLTKWEPLGYGWYWCLQCGRRKRLVVTVEHGAQ